MVEFVQNNERVSYYVTIKHGYRSFFGHVATKSLCSATFRQTYFQFRRGDLVVLREEVKGFFGLPIKN